MQVTVVLSQYSVIVFACTKYKAACELFCVMYICVCEFRSYYRMLRMLVLLKLSLSMTVIVMDNVTCITPTWLLSRFACML